jgi:glycosyltransferase involved in cell wall biosynthesis
VVLFYDASDDDSLAVLRARADADPRIHVFVNRVRVSPFRTHRLAHARNACLQWIRDHGGADAYPVFVMMDMDDVNAKTPRPDVLRRHLASFPAVDWDALSFQTSRPAAQGRGWVPHYYDIWALSVFPYCFSYNHLRASPRHNYRVLQEHVHALLAALPPGGLLPCLSAFNGFGLYRSAVFLRSRYDGTPRADLLPRAWLQAHKDAAGSQLVFPHYGHIYARVEDCEHRAFHLLAVRDLGAKVRIANDVLFY